MFQSKILWWEDGYTYTIGHDSLAHVAIDMFDPVMEGLGPNQGQLILDNTS